MVDFTTRLTQKACLLAKKQVAVGTEATLDPATDALAVANPQFQIDPQLLERLYVSSDLSPFAHVVGRKQATITFTSEVKSNGKFTGSTSDASMLARLIELCGYSLSGMTTAANQVGDVVLDFDNSVNAPSVAWAKGGTITLTKPIMYTVTVTTGGASGTAQVQVASNDLVTDDTSADVPVTVTSGTTAVALGGSGATITPTWAGNLVVDDIYRVVVMPPGIKAKPVSIGQSVGTLKLWKDGVLHKITDALGDLKITAQAGDFAKIDFTFKGNYISPVDSANPASPGYELTLPPQVELSCLTWGSNADLVAAQWTFEQQNTLTPRQSVNAKEGVKSVRITARKPQGGFDPEATLEADHPFWDEIERGKCQAFFSKVGQTQGNTIAVFMPKAQVSAMPYGDRDGLLTYQHSFAATRNNGDDEVEFFFV